MSLDFEAIYENGVLRPLRPIGLADHSRVHVTVEVPTDTAGSLNGCAGSITAEAAADLRKIIGDEFEGVDQRDW